MPVYEIISGASIAVAALMLIIPGFFTDLFGFLLLIPVTRKIFLKFAFKNKPNVHTQHKKETIDGEIIENKDILFLLDAVHFAPHFPIDVKKIGCDILLCSAYKFYGPHIGVLYCKLNLLDKLETDRLIVQEQKAPYRIETGTLNHAACHGVEKAIDFISSLGSGNTFRDKIDDAYKKLGSHENKLASYLYNSLSSIKNIKVIGPDFSNLRTPTVSFVHNKKTANEVCKLLSKKNICAWDGHFYAIKAIKKLGLEEHGGVTRLGISVYNTKEEIKNTIKVISQI